MCVQEKAEKLTQNVGASAEEEIAASFYVRQSAVRDIIERIHFSLDLFLSVCLSKSESSVLGQVIHPLAHDVLFRLMRHDLTRDSACRCLAAIAEVVLESEIIPLVRLT